MYIIQVEVLSCFVGYVTKNTRLEDPHSMHLIFSKPLPCVVYQITSSEVRCAAEVPADSIPSIANGVMVNFLKKTVAPRYVKDWCKPITFSIYMHCLI